MMRKGQRRWRVFEVKFWQDRVLRHLGLGPAIIFWATWPAILIGFFVLAILVCYSLVVILFGGATPAWDWFNALISTLASVFLAVAVGFILFRIQSSFASREEEHDMVQLLHSELVRILDELQVDLPDEKEPYYPPKRQIPISELKPELHETHFKFHYFDTQFLERAESGMLPSTDNAHTRKLIGQLHEYNKQMAHLRFLSVNATAQQEGESRYLEQARIILLLEKRLTKKTREILRIMRAKDKRKESGQGVY